MCPKCQALQDRVDELEAVLLEGKDDFPWQWRLTGKESAVLALLMSRRTLTVEAFNIVIYSGKHEHEQPVNPEKLLQVYVLKLRKKLALLGVSFETIWAHGYAMNDDNKKRIRELVQLVRHQAA